MFKEFFKVRQISNNQYGQFAYGVTIPSQFSSSWKECMVRFEESGNCLLLHRIVVARK